MARLQECQRLLLAIQVAGWLNDSALCLQAVVQCYGLLAPLIHQKIPAKPVVQVLLRCHAVLQEVPSLTRHRKSNSTSDSLSHMIAAITYHIAKVIWVCFNWYSLHFEFQLLFHVIKLMFCTTVCESNCFSLVTWV